MFLYCLYIYFRKGGEPLQHPPVTAPAFVNRGDAEAATWLELTLLFNDFVLEPQAVGLIVAEFFTEKTALVILPIGWMFIWVPTKPIILQLIRKQKELPPERLKIRKKRHS